MNKTKPLILMVDDVESNLMVLGDMLSEIDCDLAVAMNGREALEILETTIPDLILLDVMMPEVDGYEVCKWIKKVNTTKDIPVIFLTAKSETPDIVKGFELGAVDYVTKPFNGKELLSRVKTHLQLVAYQNQLKELNRTKDKFFSIISHDLKSPISTLLTSVGFLNSKFATMAEDKKQNMVGKVYESTKMVYELLENLLDWSRTHTKRIEYNPEVFQPHTVLKKSLGHLKSTAEKKEISIKNEVPTEIKVFADVKMFETVMRNLVSNAIKYCNKGDLITITSNESKDDNQLVHYFSIKDTGIGMTSETLEKLFSINSVISIKGTQNEKGTGLGLILCKEFIEMNNGKIGAESSPNEGSHFYFSLPKST